MSPRNLVPTLKPSYVTLSTKCPTEFVTSFCERNMSQHRSHISLKPLIKITLSGTETNALGQQTTITSPLVACNEMKQVRE